MKVILKEDVKKLGKEGDIVDVADGYARNYLMPRKLATKATRQKIKSLKREEKRQQKKEQEKVEEAEKTTEKIEDRIFEFSVKAGEEGRLFGSVTSKDIAEKVNDAGFEIEKKNIDLEDKIKSLGTHKIPVKIYKNVVATINVKVVEA